MAQSKQGLLQWYTQKARIQATALDNDLTALSQRTEQARQVVRNARPGGPANPLLGDELERRAGACDVLAASYAQTLEALWLIGQLPDGC